MQQLFLFLYNNRAFFVFILLQTLCGWLILSSNDYQRVAFLTSSNHVAAITMEVSNAVTSYFSLKSTNKALALENAQLREVINQLQVQQGHIRPPAVLRVVVDSVKRVGIDSLYRISTIQEYEVNSSYVINNSVNRVNNFITLDKGANDGVLPGMGVISSLGVVGIIKASSDNYATAYSLLHSDVTVSSQLKRDKTLCTTKWDGKDYRYAYLLYLSRHVHVQVGDTVTTSGYNAVFPEGILIGTVEEVANETAEVFLTVKIKLSTDFSTLTHVYVVNNKNRNQIDSLERRVMLKK
jgi:rod shape-determining protein MreC